MNSSNVRTVTLGMGCFWSPDALFGHLPGVVRTRVGYAGGTSANPTYRQLGDHSETVEIDFDPQTVTLGHLLNVFWSHHNPANINDYKGRQYRSLVLYRDKRQFDVIVQTMKKLEEQGAGKPDTEVSPFSEFYLAEDRHQKYYLKRYPDAIAKLGAIYPSHEDLVNSTLAARLNGLAKGYANMEQIVREIRSWPLEADERDGMIRLIRQIKW
ncbi:peptide-methionine (S)-S-oxide reductase MsrA [Paenibacillus hamazuiensis]|uniref:peptide-methionine (S)-S-oxide reductase MsrA n=1 Tax=Paenibacillus hamazuiensis TaxID=2936508 RepID=UPI00200C622B|nr:peptide-methionine (S)-S-oxide reductase MsrA [Paenibacillus hamazuiensis]